MTGLGFYSTTASALEIVNFDVFDEGGETWVFVGDVNVNQEFGEIAEITFGGVLSGTSTTTDYYGHFSILVEAPYGSMTSLTASTATETTATSSWQFFDPAGEP